MVHSSDTETRFCDTVKIDSATISQSMAREQLSLPDAVEAESEAGVFDAQVPSRSEPRIVQRPRLYGSFY